MEANDVESNGITFRANEDMTDTQRVRLNRKHGLDLFYNDSDDGQVDTENASLDEGEVGDPNLHAGIDAFDSSDDYAHTSDLKQNPDIGNLGSIISGDSEEEGEEERLGPNEWRIPAPPEHIYESLQAAKGAVMAFSSNHGYELASKVGKSLKPGLPHHCYVLRCTRHGTLDNTRNLSDSQRIRAKRPSKKCGCKMAIWLRAIDPRHTDGEWKVQHYKGIQSEVHTHRPAKAILLPGIRRWQREKIIEEIKHHRAAGVRVQQSLALLQRKFPDLQITRKDVQNERDRLRREALKHHTPAEACLNLLDELKFYKDYETGEDNRIQRLYFTDPKSIELLKENSDILVLDCTYQTNEYNIPLLNIIGASSIGKTTQVGLCFLSGEAEHDFNWAIKALHGLFEGHGIRFPRIIITDRQIALMNALKTYFPTSHHLICRWHFNKCVLAKARGSIHKQVKHTDAEGKEEFFDHTDTVNFMQLFYRCIDTDDVDEFQRLKDELDTDYPVMREYFEKNWWPWKERLAKCYTNQYMHYGEQCSSRVEGQHARLKRWLQSSRRDLFGFLEACLPYFSLLYNSHMYHWERQSIDQPYTFKQGIFPYTYRVITNFALFKADEQRKFAEVEIGNIRNPRHEQQNPSKCNGVFEKVFGIPCKHRIIPLLLEGKQLEPKMFDSHWWIKRGISEEELQRSRILEPKVKPRKKRKALHTLRIPSSFEFSDLNHPASRRPREYPEPPPPQLPGLNPTPPVPASQPFIQNGHPEASQPSSATNAQVQGVSTTAQIQEPPRVNPSATHQRTVPTPSSSYSNTTSSVLSATLQIGQRQLQPLQPQLPYPLPHPQHQIASIQRPQARQCLLDRPSEYPSLPSLYPNSQPAFLPQQSRQNGSVFQDYSTQPSPYTQYAQPQYPLQVHHPQPAIQQSHHTFNPPAPSTQNIFSPSQPYQAQLSRQSQCLTQSSHTSTPQNAGFVQPFLPGRAHHYVAYTSEDTTSSQFR